MLQASLYALLWVGALRQALPGAQLPCLSSGGSVRACRRPALKPTMGIASPKMMSAPTPAYAAYTSTGPMLSMFELRADGRVTPYQSTLTSMHSTHKLPSRDVRLLRSSTPVLAVRNGFVLFDLGDVKGVLQHDRVVLLGPNGQKVKAIGEEVKQRFNTISRSSNGEEYPFEVLVLECLYEVSYTLLEQSLQRLTGLINDLLAQLTDSSATQSDSRRGAALGRLLPLQISLNELRSRSRRLTTVLQELLEDDEVLSGMCLSLFERRKRGLPPPNFVAKRSRVAAEAKAAAQAAAGAAAAAAAAQATAAQATAAQATAAQATAAQATAAQATAAQATAAQATAASDLNGASFTSFDGQPGAWKKAGGPGADTGGGGGPVPPVEEHVAEAERVQFESERAEAERVTREKAEAEAREEEARELQLAEEAEALKEEEVVETLLDVYLARLEALTDRVQQLATNIETTQGVLELTLDNERNRIARLELILSMAGLAIGAAACVSSFFGMNLISGLENAARGFITTVIASTLLSTSIFAVAWRRFRSVSREQGSRLNDVKVLKSVLSHLDTVGLLLRGQPPLPRNPKEMRERLEGVLRSSGLPSFAPAELSLLCDILKRQREQEESVEAGQQWNWSKKQKTPPTPELAL